MTTLAEDEATLETDRLWLEPLGAVHAPDLFVALGAPAIYAFVAEQPPASLAELTARYADLVPRYSPDGRERWLNWAVRDKASRCCIGHLQATVRPSAIAEIAYLFTPAVHGRGFATEACRAMIERLVTTYGAREIEARIDTRNTPSRRLAERLGLVHVCTVPGEPGDDAVYRG